MVEFCQSFTDPITRSHCERLTSEYNMTLEDFDTGVFYTDLKGDRPRPVAPKPDGKGDGPEVHQQVIRKAEDEYTKDPSGQKPFLKYLAETKTDIPWLFKDPKNLELALKRTKGLPNTDLKLLKGLYALLMGKDRKDGYRIAPSQKQYMEELDIDGWVKRKIVRCNEFVMMFMGFNLLVGGPELEIYQTIKGDRIGNDTVEHMFLVYKDYIIDMDKGVKKAGEEMLDAVKISPLEMLAIYHKERSYNCDAEDNQEKIFECADKELAWASRYAPDNFYVAYTYGYWLGRKNDYKAAIVWMKRALEIFPGFVAAKSAISALETALKK